MTFLCWSSTWWKRYARRAGKTVNHIEKKTLDILQAYDWPGNIRELQNVIERAVILCDGETFSVDETWLRPKSGQLSGRSVSRHGGGQAGWRTPRCWRQRATSEMGRVPHRLGSTNGPAIARLGSPASTDPRLQLNWRNRRRIGFCRSPVESRSRPPTCVSALYSLRALRPS
jgi:hypothetical protein